jgi:hypothetical protein
MIDWQVKVLELKQTADELDLWASKAEGRQRTVLGRIADELRHFALQIERELVPPDALPVAEVPDWLAAIVEPSVNEVDGYDTGEAAYAAGDDQWNEDGSDPGTWNTMDAPYA